MNRVSNFFRNIWNHENRYMLLFTFYLIAVLIFIFCFMIFDLSYANSTMRTFFKGFSAFFNLSCAIGMVIMYQTVYKKNYSEHKKHYASSIFKYKTMMAEYPDVKWMRPADFRPSYRKMRWYYFIGICLNVLIAVFDILRV